MIEQAIALLPAVADKPSSELTKNELAVEVERLALEVVRDGLREPLSVKDGAWLPRLQVAVLVMKTIASVQAEALRHSGDAQSWRAFAKSAAEFEKKLYAGKKGK